MTALNPEPSDIDLSDLPPVPRRRNTDILRNPSPQLRNPSPGHRNPSPHGDSTDVDLTAVKAEPEDKGYEVHMWNKILRYVPKQNKVTEHVSAWLFDYNDLDSKLFLFW